jgi:hypothetical protein
MSEQLTRGRVAAAAVALVALAAVVVLLAVVGPGWWGGDGGSYAPKKTLVHADVTPAHSLFGQVLTAHARLVVDPRDVDPASVDLNVNLNPFHIRSESHRVTRGLGRAAVVDFTYEIQCVSRACVPFGTGKGALVEQLKAATATYRTPGGAKGSVQVHWPVFGVQSRLTAEEIGLSTPEAAPGSAQPPVSWAISPGLLGGISLAVAALLVLGAGGLVASVLTRDDRLVRVRRIPAHMSAIERALVLAEHATAHGEVDESRKALERLAEELRRKRAGSHANDAERLAWSEGGPSPETVAALATTVRSNGVR